MMEYNLQEAAYRLRVSEKTLRRWLHQSRIAHRIDHGKYLIPESAVASIVARKETVGSDGLIARIESLELKISRLEANTLLDRIEAIESNYSAISDRLRAIETLLKEKPAPVSPTPATLRPARAEYASMPDEHSGLVPYFRFYHGVPANTAKRLMEVAGVTIIRGHWIDAGHHYDKALDAEGRRLAYLALHNHPRFQPCDACPHQA